MKGVVILWLVLIGRALRLEKNGNRLKEPEWNGDRFVFEEPERELYHLVKQKAD
jgi:hypothetical protein